MDVQIGEVQSTVRVNDSQALLDPRILEQLLKTVLKRVKEELDHQQRVDDERALRPGASSREAKTWS